MKIKKTSFLIPILQATAIAALFLSSFAVPVSAASEPLNKYVRCIAGASAEVRQSGERGIQAYCTEGSIAILGSRAAGSYQVSMICTGDVTSAQPVQGASGSSFIAFACPDTRADSLSASVIAVDVIDAAQEAQDNGALNGEGAGGLEAIDDTLRCADGEKGIELSEGKCLEGFDADAAGTPLERNPIITYLAIMIRFVMVGVGVIITAVIIIAGIRYTVAKGNPQETAAAKDMIQKAIIGIVMYAFSGAIINFLIPGGLI